MRTIEQMIESQRRKLRALEAKAKDQSRRDETRRKILYGAAYLAAVADLPDQKREQSMARVHEHIRRNKDREFLGLPCLPRGEGAS